MYPEGWTGYRVVKYYFLHYLSAMRNIHDRSYSTQNMLIKYIRVSSVLRKQFVLLFQILRVKLKIHSDHVNTYE